MKIREIYDMAISMGIAADPRGEEAVRKELTKLQQTYDKLDDDEKEFFDVESLTNPYADSRILFGDEDQDIKKVICGVDMESGEIAVVAMLNSRGAKIDLIWAHHPEGGALAALPEVMKLQSGVVAAAGVLPNVAEGLLDQRIKEVDKSIGVVNHYRSVDSARLLGIPMICIHTPADNLVTQYITNYMKNAAPDTIGDLIKLLKEVPEYRQAAINHNPPRIVAGTKDRTAGKIFVDYTGGTSGPKEFLEKLCDAGISTVLCMHATDGMVEEAKKVQLNLVIAGHMASDSLGLNLLLDQVERRGVEIVAAAGLIRHQRD